MYNIDASVYVMTLPDNIVVHYRLLLPPDQLLHLKEIVRVCTKLGSGILSTSSGMSSSSVLCLVGIDDAEEHGVSGMKAGHWHLSLLHFWHMSGFSLCDMFIHLNADSKSKLALLLCNSLWYIMMALPFSVGACPECLLTSDSAAVWLILPQPWMGCGTTLNCNVVSLSVVLAPSSIRMASPRSVG